MMDNLISRMGTSVSTDRLMPPSCCADKKGLEGKMTKTKAQKGLMPGLTSLQSLSAIKHAYK
jgi:hypothetical protein